MGEVEVYLCYGEKVLMCTSRVVLIHTLMSRLMMVPLQARRRKKVYFVGPNGGIEGTEFITVGFLGILMKSPIPTKSLGVRREMPDK